MGRAILDGVLVQEQYSRVTAGEIGVKPAEWIMLFVNVSFLILIFVLWLYRRILF